jgi:threonine/homoserine/homoserine lactone efflux protein
MDVSILFKGLIAGITIAMPLGPVNLLCIHRTLAKGSKNGLISGMGAAVADTIYGIIAGFGLTLVSSFLLNHENYLRVIGGLFILILGLKVYFSHPKDDQYRSENRSLLRAFTSTFFLTITNPLTILAFIGIFAGLGLTTKSINTIQATVLVTGVFLGSSVWWSLLSGGVNMFRDKFTDKTLLKINHIAGTIIGLFGILLIISLFFNINFG